MSTNHTFLVAAQFLPRVCTEMIRVKGKHKALMGFELWVYITKLTGTLKYNYNNHVFPARIAYYIKYLSDSFVKCCLNDFKYCKK